MLNIIQPQGDTPRQKKHYTHERITITPFRPTSVAEHNLAKKSEFP